MLCSLVVDKLGSSGGTLTDLAVTRWLVGHRELTEVISNHITLDFDWVPVLSRVDFADGTDHFWHDDAVAEMCLDWLGLLTVWAVLDREFQLLDQPVVAWVDTMTEASFLSGSEHGDHILRGKLKKLLKLDTSVKLFFEWFFGCAKGLRLGGLKFLFGSSHY